MELFIEKNKRTILVLIFSLAVFLISFNFTDTPKVWVDEGVFTEVAKNLALHGVLGLQTEPGVFFSMRNFLLTTSYPVIFPVATSFNLFGTGIWQARLPMILYMFGLIVVFYFFTKKKYGFSAAVLSVLMLLSFSPFYGNGRPVQGEVPGLFFLVLGAWLLLFLEESNFQSKKWALLSGLAIGLSASTKPIFLVGVSLALMISLLFWFKKIENKKILLFLGVGFVLPILIWFYTHFPNLKSLLEFIPNVLYFSGNHEVQIPLYQTVTTNFLKFFTESTPILFLLLFLAIIFSAGYKFYKKENLNLSASEFFVFLFIILNWLGFLVGTGWYRYFFPAHTLLYLFFPASVLTLSQFFKKEVLKRLLLIFLAVLIAFQFFHLVFLSDTSFTVKRTRNTELTTSLSKIDPSQKVLFYGSIEAVVFLGGDNYSQYIKIGDFLETGDKNTLTTNPDLYDIVFTDASQKDNRFLLACYDKKSVSRYFLFQKMRDCKK